MSRVYHGNKGTDLLKEVKRKRQKRSNKLQIQRVNVWRHCLQFLDALNLLKTAHCLLPATFHGTEMQ